MAATLLYLQIDFDGKAVAGEGTAKDFSSQIEVESFDWGIQAKHTENARDREVNTSVTTESLTIEKFFDSSSTKLAQYMKDSKPFKKAILRFADGTIVDGRDTSVKPVLMLTLEDGFIEDIKLSCSSAGKAMAVKETVTLGFKKLELQYRPPVQATDSRGAACVFVTTVPTAV
jgi:type VI protein secretion system component Hcp